MAASAQIRAELDSNLWSPLVYLPFWLCLLIVPPTIPCKVQARKPFVVVPCCVFSRLFPTRTTADGRVVSTRAELIAWLLAKHPALRTVTLPFDGANVAVYCAAF